MEGVSTAAPFCLLGVDCKPILGSLFKSLVTEPRVTGGESDKEGEALGLQEMREASPQA